jgi:DNA invertase Pin-like site-specific DNA recombinase
LATVAIDTFMTELSSDIAAVNCYTSLLKGQVNAVSDHEDFPVIIAARLSQRPGKKRGRREWDQGLGIDSQDKRSREWCDAQDLRVVAMVADYKSGRIAPWDRPHLKPWVTQPELMQQYKGIVAFKNDRLSRGSWEDETRIRLWAVSNGKRLMIVDGPQWPPRHEGDRWAWEASADNAAKEWEASQERNLRYQRELREAGKLVGAAPFGYDIVGEYKDKTLVPDEELRDIIHEMFQRIADGESLSTVAAWLNGLHIKEAKWGPKTVSQVIKNRTYAGTRMNTKGQAVLKVPTVVDAKLWKRANDRLANAPRGRRGPSKLPPAFLSGVLYCDRCKAPMYRMHAYYYETQDWYYRCAGSYPERIGCGNMIRIDTLDGAVDDILSRAPEPYTKLTLVQGQNYDAEIQANALELGDLPKQGLPDDQEDAERQRLRAERDKLLELNKHARPDEWKKVNTDRTVGQEFASRDFDGKREMMLQDVKVFASRADVPEVGIENAPTIRIESRLFTWPHEWTGAARP